jgi:hypothetical protein
MITDDFVRLRHKVIRDRADTGLSAVEAGVVRRVGWQVVAAVSG